MTTHAEYVERAKGKLTVAEFGAVQAIARRDAKAALQAERKARREARPPVETPEYAEGIARLIAAHGKRVADADPEDLARLLDLQADLDQAVVVAIAGQRAQGHSWAHIGRAAGTSRQAAFQRWGLNERAAGGN